MRPDPAVHVGRAKARAVGGHGPDPLRGGFPGGGVLHGANGAGGRGVRCASDLAMVAMDRAAVSSMHSYPNLVPLSSDR